MNGPLLWPDPESSSFYLWGCWAFPIEDTPNVEDLWVFKADGSGDGSWELKNSANPSFFSSLHHAQGRTPATCNGVGYALGGRIFTDDDPLGVPGLVTYQMNTSTWANESTEGFPYTPRGGAGSCIPHVGREGLVIFYGTLRFAEDNNERHFKDTEFSTFENLAIFDISNKRWFFQKTTGDAPPPMILFCSVGVQGPNGTYEMCVATHVLTLPQ